MKGRKNIFSLFLFRTPLYYTAVPLHRIRNKNEKVFIGKFGVLEMSYNVVNSVAKWLAMVVLPQSEWDDFNKELRALRKCLEKDCKPYNNRRRKSAKKRRRRIDVASVCDSAKWWRDLIPVILVLAAFTTGEILHLDSGALDRLLYILAAYSQTLVSCRSCATREKL